MGAWNSLWLLYPFFEVFWRGSLVGLEDVLIYD